MQYKGIYWYRGTYWGLSPAFVTRWEAEDNDSGRGPTKHFAFPITSRYVFGYISNTKWRKKTLW